jgi:chloramphenicol 3-O-phosphotransferase
MRRRPRSTTQHGSPHQETCRPQLPRAATCGPRLRRGYLRAQPAAKTERRAIVLAGPPGAGKSTTLGKVLGDDRDNWLVIDPDEFKKMLLNEAVRDGTYESIIKPQAVRDLEADGQRFYPLELASLVHEESTAIAKALRHEALRDGVNVVIDSTLASPRKAHEIGAELTAAGYDIHVIDVEVPQELSEQRVRLRWESAYSYGDAEHLGGRWVPSEFIDALYTAPDGRAKSQECAELLAREYPSVSRIQRFWTPDVGADARLETDLRRLARGGPLIPAEVAEARQVANMGFPNPVIINRQSARHRPSALPGRTTITNQAEEQER